VPLQKTWYPVLLDDRQHKTQPLACSQRTRRGFYDKTDYGSSVRLWGIKGAPPPPTTKLAIFYNAGYQSEIVINATGYGTAEKFDFYEQMIRFGLKRLGIHDKFDVLEFQRIGVPELNPRSQLRSTTYLRIFAESADPKINLGLTSLLGESSQCSIFPASTRRPITAQPSLGHTSRTILPYTHSRI
jgi:hypothetical protein